MENKKTIKTVLVIISIVVLIVPTIRLYTGYYQSDLIWIIPLYIIGVVCFIISRNIVLLLDEIKEDDEVSSFILGLKGDYADTKIPISDNEELILGKSTEVSNLPINGKSISRKHCSIRFDRFKNLYFVTDFSSNGTFLQNGQKLMANTKNDVAKGTVIELGNNENSFKLI